MNTYPPSVLHPSYSKPLDIPSARTFLANFLRLANLDPAYRPDSILSDHGPQSNSSSGNPTLILHHLNRIKLGLEGNHLGAETLAEGQFGESKNADTTEFTSAKKRKWRGRDAGIDSIGTGKPEVISTAEDTANVVLITPAGSPNTQKVVEGEGWQDREDFELAQDDTDVDVNNAQRDPTAADMEGIGEEIMDGKTGKMIDARGELEEQEEEEEAEIEGPGHTADEQRIEEGQEREDMKRKIDLTLKDKEERKKRKKLKPLEERRSKNVAKAKERSATDRRDEQIETKSPQKKRKKMKSRVDE